MRKWPHIDRMRHPGYGSVSGKRYREKNDPAVKRLFSRPVVAEEKLDGGFRAVEWHGKPEVYAKSRPLTDLDNRDKRHFMLYDWAYAHSEILENIPEGHTLCGEYMLATHHVFYSALPCYFVGFAIADSEGRFLSPQERRAALARWGISQPPVIFEGMLKYEDVPLLVQDRKSSFGDEINEGCIVKSAEKEECVQSGKEVTFNTMFKFVRREFSDELEESGNWLREPLKINRIAPDGCRICKELEQKAKKFEGRRL